MNSLTFGIFITNSQGLFGDRSKEVSMIWWSHGSIFPVLLEINVSKR